MLPSVTTMSNIIAGTACDMRLVLFGISCVTSYNSNSHFILSAGLSHIIIVVKDMVYISCSKKETYQQSRQWNGNVLMMISRDSTQNTRKRRYKLCRNVLVVDSPPFENLFPPSPLLASRFGRDNLPNRLYRISPSSLSLDRSNCMAHSATTVTCPCTKKWCKSETVMPSTICNLPSSVKSRGLAFCSGIWIGSRTKKADIRVVVYTVGVHNRIHSPPHNRHSYSNSSRAAVSTAVAAS